MGPRTPRSTVGCAAIKERDHPRNTVAALQGFTGVIAFGERDRRTPEPWKRSGDLRSKSATNGRGFTLRLQ